MARLMNARVWYHGFELSGDLNAVALESMIDVLDATTLTASARTRTGGLRAARAQLEGLVRAAVQPDFGINQGFASDGLPLSIATSATEGDVAYTMPVVAANYQPGGTVGELHRFSFAAESQSLPAIRGVLAANRTLVAAGDDAGLLFNLGPVGDGQRLYAALHVPSFSPGDTLDLGVQSEDGSTPVSPTQIITFTQMAGSGSQFLSVAGPITDTHFRAFATAGGSGISINYVLVIGIL